MNAKKAKAIRRYVRSLGRTKAELPAPRSSAIGYKDPVTGKDIVYDLPLTARYPGNSFQHVYTLAKRTLRNVRTGIINMHAQAAMA